MGCDPVRPLNRNATVYCPKCGALMILRVPREGADFDPFWACEMYPDCRATVRVDRMGEPEPEKELWWI
ncbi:MAG: topoisomerase DNA-binding C4 zinc finger domain-containing protein [Anaerolineales bacterium]